MTKYLILSVILSLSVTSYAQFDSSADTDPKAKSILKEIKKQFDSDDQFEASFTMNIQYPGQENIVEKGELIQSGDQFHLNLVSYLIISNDVKKWVYLKDDNTANIYSAKSAGSWVTPKDFLQIYDDTNFVYAMVPTELEQNEQEHLIEFKSLNSDSEYSKMRLAVDKKTTQIKSVKAFAKDGSRYELVINNINFNPTIASSIFQFDPSKYPGVMIEDLRID